MREVLLTSSALILALLVLRQVFRKRISRRVQYALWGLVLVRLLVLSNISRKLCKNDHLSLEGGRQYIVHFEARLRSAKNAAVLGSKAVKLLFHQVPAFFKGLGMDDVLPALSNELCIPKKTPATVTSIFN